MLFFMGEWVNLGKEVPYERLEGAIAQAANDMGWSSRTENEYSREWTLGSVTEERIYLGTTVELFVEETGGGSFFGKPTKKEKRMIGLTVWNNGQHKGRFLMTHGVDSPIVYSAGEPDVRKFLEKLGNYL